MKKLLILILPIFLFSCFGFNKDEVKKAKQEIFSNNNGDNNVLQETKQETVNNLTDKQEIKEQKSSYVLTNLSGNDFIDLEEIKDIENITDFLEINGIVNNPSIDKIVITFENPTSNFPKDIYTLKTFKKGDKKFLYRAYRKYQVLDNGLNKYLIEAYIQDKVVSSLFLEVNIVGKVNLSNLDRNTNSSNLKYKDLTIGGENDSVFLSLPIDENLYGEPLLLSETQFTYSLIDNFEVNKDLIVFNLNCDNYGDYLKQNYSWYYWNTCRPIGTDSFYINVLFLNNGNYFYERHYLNKKYGFFAKLLLESGTGVNKDNLFEKNNELKLKTFDITQKTDKLFIDLK